MMQTTPRFSVLLALGLLACASSGDPSGGMSGSQAATGNATTGSGGAGGTASSGSSSTGTTGASDGTTASATGGDPATQTCPLARPAEGTACTSAAPGCPYDEIECRCQTGAWSCVEPVHPDCPASVPASGSTCDLPEATECDFLQQECECLSGLWECESESETDGGAPPETDGGPQADGGPVPARECPEARPAESTTCEPSDATCNYESTECVCPDGVWSCSEPVDMGCPSTPPLHGDACTGLADCDFLEVECECLFGSWNCKPND